MPGILRALRFGLVAAIAFCQAARADLENENFLVSVPAGYKIDFQQRKSNLLMTEMVPANENVKNWTEMVTVQIFFGVRNVTPEQFKDKIELLWQAGCAGSTSKTISQGAERGYPMIVWAVFCPLNRATGKPENTWFKAIQGNDSFYVVQKAFKFMPSKEQENKWLRYLKDAPVCDARLAERACPKAKP